MAKNQNSSHLDKAFALIESVRGKPQTVEERKKTAVELAGFILDEANTRLTHAEKKQQSQLARLMQDPNGKAFTTAMTDQCFRSESKSRIANQMCYLLDSYGVPSYLSFSQKLGLYAFKLLGRVMPQLFVPAAIFLLRKESEKVILPGEKQKLKEHIQKRTKEGVKHNLNHLGEAILSEQEALKRLEMYIHDLEDPEINYVSIKISTIFSQINLLAWEYSIEKTSEKLRRLYRAAIDHPFVLDDGSKKNKFVNLDMEEYRDLHLTVEVFKKVLDEPEFFHLSAGIVLQAYIPDSFDIQKDITEWAIHRIKNGGAPVKIRIVKGANLAMEQVEASIRTWPQAPYTSKMESDANYKRMVTYGCIPEHARAVHLGIASHNIFDIAYALLLQSENQVEGYTEFEMLEGMADHIRRVVQEITGSILLYCPVAKKEDFKHAIAYLIRRLDENTGSENFLRHVFKLKPGTGVWEQQASFFMKSCDLIQKVSHTPRRTQNRDRTPVVVDGQAPFDNEADTDFSLPQNRKWGEKIVKKYHEYRPDPLPIVVGGKAIRENAEGEADDPSFPKRPLFRYMLAKKEHLELALKTAKDHEKSWSNLSVKERSKLIHKTTQIFKERRDDFLGVMMIDTGKTLLEGDPEHSEAIDYLEYYRKQMEKMETYKDIEWWPKGTVLVTPPWNFPVAIPVGGITAGLITGNCVLFKPAPEAVLVGWHIVNAFWDAGVPKEVLQFINCNDDPEGSLLIQDPRIKCVILTGATSTAKKFHQLRPGIDLAAETGGKNAMIITALSDRDLAIKDLIHSAFSHAGQKCSAASLAILEKEVYDDPHFLKQLKEAAASMKVGPAHDLSVKIGPIIRAPSEALKRGLTTLDEGEEWLLQPHPDPHNPNLWTPGIKLGVKLGSFTQQTELFGPVLGLIRAKNLDEAIAIANSTKYGLTAGLQSLDEREQKKWIREIEAGNCYINRTMTGAIVRRQPFGGTKESSFGAGSKAGGPNYLRELMHPKEVELPQEKYPINEWVNSLTAFFEKIPLSKEELGVWYASTANYSYWWKRMQEKRDVTKLVGQDNFFFYLPRKNITLRLNEKDPLLDHLRVIAAALTCKSPLEISWTSSTKSHALNWVDLVPLLRVVDETEEEFLERVKSGKMRRVRIVSKANDALKKASAPNACHIAEEPVLSNGRFELLYYLREVALSIDYHRYGNLGLREGEIRKPIL